MPETILSIDTATAGSTRPASIALLHDGQITSYPLPEPHSQAAQLIPTIERALAEHQLSYADLTTCLITVGPGSFTGIRIGLAVARSLAFSLPTLSLTPLTTMEALAGCYNGQSELLEVLLPAGKGELYHQSFDMTESGWAAAAPITLVKPEQWKVRSGAGSFAPEILPTAADHILALDRVVIEPREPLPLYIRPPDAKPQPAMPHIMQQNSG